MTETQQVSIVNLDGANQTLSLLVSTLRELRASGISPSIEDMLRGCHSDGDDPMVALARTSLLLTLAIQRLADGQPS